MRHILFIVLLALPGLSTWNTASADSAIMEVVFSAAEVAIMRDYYKRDGGGTKTRGGKKAKGLPPGIAKNLQRGKPLPPGIAKQFLPGDLSHALPPPPDGHERITLDGKILLVEIATQVVVDVLTDVLFDG